jgi:steroid 5-alpha reductase family enzyme
MGFVFLGAQWSAGHPGDGLVSLAIMAVTAAVFAFGGRSETIRGLRGDGRDERFARIDLEATALAGMAVITVIIVAVAVQLARDRNPAPYDWLGAIAGVVYLVAVIAGRFRR